VADKGSQQSGDMKVFYWLMGAVVLIAVAGVAWSVTRNVATNAATEPLEMEFADAQELVRAAVGVERGDPNAPITIMEFGDYQCPACGAFATRVKPQVDLAFVQSGIAKFVFQDFPLRQHPHAFLAARAARCALDQGSDYYWPYHDQLFQHQTSWSSSATPPISNFEGYAEAIGLDVEEFSACLNSDKFADVVTANMHLGLAMNVSGTPTIFVSKGGGIATRVNEWGDVREFERIINQMLEADSGGQD